MNRFELLRPSGVVAAGVRLDDGRAIIRWRGPRTSMVVWPAYADAIEVHSHDGRTHIIDGGAIHGPDRGAIVAAVDLVEETLTEAFRRARRPEPETTP